MNRRQRSLRATVIGFAANLLPGVVTIKERDLHVEVDSEMRLHHSHEIAHRVKDIARIQMPSIHDVLVLIEPSNSSRSNRSD